MPLFFHFRPDIAVVESKIELWRGQELGSITDRALNFGFEPVIAGQVPRLLNHFDGTFIQKIAGGIKIQMSFILNYDSQSAQGDDGEINLEISSAANIFSTENFDFSITNRSGTYNKTNHLLGHIEAIIDNNFQVLISKIFSSEFLNIGISDIRLFAKDLN